MFTNGSRRGVGRIGRGMIGAAGLAMIAGQALAQDGKPAGGQGGGTTITIYSSAQPGAIPAAVYRPTPASMGLYNPWQGRPLPGYAVVKVERPVTLGKGRSVLEFTDVAALIDPTTVSFESLTAPATTRVLEQNFQFDLVSSQKMLERFVGKAIEVDGQSVTLLNATAGGLLLKESNGQIRMLTDMSKTSIRFPADGSAGLILKPTLIWNLSAEQEGEHKARVGYQTEGITWWADYNLVFKEGANANSGTLDVGAWVSILNQSGGSYENAKLKLVAGDVHRAPQPGQTRAGGRYELAAKAGIGGEEDGFQQKDFFEYHLYTLGRPTTIPESSTKQVELFTPARNVPAEKILVYYGLEEGFRASFFPNAMTDRNFGIQGNKKVDTYLKFKNAKEQGLGIPLPAGRVRVSKMDAADKSLEFIGEDVLDHTPQNEDVLIKMGSAFDVVGERIQADFSVDERAHRMEETIQIKLRNHKKEAVTVIVKENLYRWTNWEIVQKSADFTKVDARTIQFPVRAEPEKEVVVTYKVRYTW